MYKIFLMVLESRGFLHHVEHGEVRIVFNFQGRWFSGGFTISLSRSKQN